jgi:hypothetical protein
MFICQLLKLETKMNISNYLGSVPTVSTIGVVLYVILYAISICQTKSFQNWREETLKIQ